MSASNEDLSYFPNGELNISFLLFNANLLLQEGELELAASLFQLVKNHHKYGYCGHYGIGQCFLKAQQPKLAAQAFERAYSLEKRPYIAVALIDALIACEYFEAAEIRSIEFAREFSAEPKFVELFRQHYRMCLEKLTEQK